MELYYHVTRLKRKKDCLFEFCYIGRYGKRVCGRVTASLSGFPANRSFDADSCLKLSDTEKDYILTGVMKNISYT